VVIAQFERITALKDHHFLQVVSADLPSDWALKLSKLSGEYEMDKSRGSAEKKASPALRVFGEEIRTSRASNSSLISGIASTFKDRVIDLHSKLTHFGIEY